MQVAERRLQVVACVHLRDEPSRSEFGVTEAEVTGQPARGFCCAL